MNDSKLYMYCDGVLMETNSVAPIDEKVTDRDHLRRIFGKWPRDFVVHGDEHARMGELVGFQLTKQAKEELGT